MTNPEEYSIVGVRPPTINAIVTIEMASFSVVSGTTGPSTLMLICRFESGASSFGNSLSRIFPDRSCTCANSSFSDRSDLR